MYEDILEQMEIVRKLDSLGQRLRKENNTPLKQPLLDYGFGGEYKGKFVYIDKDHKRLLAEGLNIYNQGYDFANNDFYYCLDISPPEGERWKTLEKNGLWVSLNFEIPNWLKKVYEKRKADRKEAMRRKKLNLPYHPAVFE